MKEVPSLDAIPELEKPEPSRLPQLSALGQHVSARAYALQKAYIADVPSAVASLAKLRRAIGTQPGDDSAAWPEVFNGLDHLGWDSDDPTAEEWAAHIALTLFALHQQSQTSTQMHNRGHSLGRSVRELVDVHGGPDDEGSKAMRRRFQVLGTSSSIAEAAHHARGLIVLLRGQSIVLDYGLLADHLVKLQDPVHAPRVRLAWGRDFYRTPRRSQPDGTTQTTDDTIQGDPS